MLKYNQTNDNTNNTSRNSNTTQPPSSQQQTSRPIIQQHHYFSNSTTLLIGTSIVNSTASILKDRAYAQLYGNNTDSNNTSSSSGTVTKRIPVPKITYGLWLVRDVTVIGAAFVLPHYVAQFLQKQQQQRLYSNDTVSYRLSDKTISRIAQVGTPVVAQVIAGPLHFIGYDYYNHRNNVVVPKASSFHTIQHQVYERFNNLRSSLGQVIVARMIRILPGYGIAGIFNTELLCIWQKNMIDPMIRISSLQEQEQLSSLSPSLCRPDMTKEPNLTPSYWGKWSDHHHHHQKC
jgi:hypothetical protein